MRRALGKPTAKRVRGEALPARTSRPTQPSAVQEAKPSRRRPAARKSTAPPPKPRRKRPAVAATVVATPKAAAIPRATGLDEALHTSMRGDREPEAEGRVMELSWGDDAPVEARPPGLVQRWVERGDALLRRLAEHGAARHEYRAELSQGRFVWVDPDGRVSAEAKARVLCSWSRSTSTLVMAWADPLVRDAGVGRIDGMSPEHDEIDEERAWQIAMEAADGAQAAYLYRVTTPDVWYFLALSEPTFLPERASFRPGTPVGLVLRGLAEARRGIESRAEPTSVVRDRLTGLGRALLQESEYAYRGTDWVVRLERAGRRLLNLADQLPRESFRSVAAGRRVDEWLSREATIELSQAIALLEDEWALFA
jgi:hypothetical protein